jgi:hypothetical protein
VSPSEISTAEYVLEMHTKAEERDTSQPARKSRRGLADARRKEKNKESSARTRRLKKEHILKLKAQKETMEATIERLRDEQCRLREEYEIARRRLDNEKASLREIDEHFRYRGAEGGGGVETDRDPD